MIVGAVKAMTEKFTTCDAEPFAFVAERVKLELPTIVGVPLSSTDVVPGVRLKPAGSAPAETAQVVIVCDATNVCE